MGAEFITFDNAVNAMMRIIRRCSLSGCIQKLFMSFLLPADCPLCRLSGGNYSNDDLVCLKKCNCYTPSLSL